MKTVTVEFNKEELMLMIKALSVAALVRNHQESARALMAKLTSEQTKLD